MVIHPEVIVTPDCPTVKFRQPREQVDLGKELQKILHHQGWGCGTIFNVQFINHDRTKLLACARFVVTEEIEATNISEVSQYQTMTKTVITRQAEQIEDWWKPRTGEAGHPEEVKGQDQQTEPVPRAKRQAAR